MKIPGDPRNNYLAEWTGPRTRASSRFSS
jgi:hypothetical protein